jgi:hypothetical protein
MSREMSREEPRYLTVDQVAKRYGMTVKWVHRSKALRKYGTRIGKYLRFLESDLEAFEIEMRSATRGYIIRRDDNMVDIKTLRKKLKMDIR